MVYIRKKGKRYYAIYRKNGKEVWVGGATPEEAMENMVTPKLSLKEYVEYYLAHIEVKQRTLETYKYALQSLTKAVSKPLDELTTVDIQNWLTNLNLSNRTKKDYYSAVRTALKQAVLWNFIRDSPHVGVVVPTAKKTAGKAYTVDQVKLILENANELYLPIILQLFCGLRVSECCGLRKDRIGDEYITIDAQLQRVIKLREGDVPLTVPVGGKTRWALITPKTATSNANVAMPGMVSDAIRNHIAPYDRYHTGLLLLEPDGRPIDPSTLRKRFKRLCKRIGVPVLRLHDLRHTTATLLLEAGLAPVTVQHEMRHADVNITQNIYQHLTENMKNQPAKVFDEMFATNGLAGKTAGKPSSGNIKMQAPENSETCENAGLVVWSGRRDSNSRPLVPETSALPNCATPRQHAYYSKFISICQL